MCDEYLYPLETAKVLDKKRNEIMEGLIRRYPIEDFMTATEAAKSLDMSRQALHKNRRIRRGFIYQTKFYGKTVYLKKSVERFKEKGDGRFLIHKPIIFAQTRGVLNEPQTLYKIVTISRAKRTKVGDEISVDNDKYITPKLRGINYAK